MARPNETSVPIKFKSFKVIGKVTSKKNKYRILSLNLKYCSKFIGLYVL